MLTGIDQTVHRVFSAKFLVIASQVIDITVKFSDELLLETSGVRESLPTLSLNNGGEAILTSGTGTTDWIFSYEFPGGNGTAVPTLDVANTSARSRDSAINCTDSCRAANWNGARANMSVSAPRSTI